jgi:hypothetical protein
VPELEQELRALGGQLFPPTPDIAGAVRRRLAEAPPRGFALRRALVLGLAVLAVAVGAVMAVPQARTAILEWLGLRGVTIERVPTKPEAPPAEETNLALGEPVTLAAARSRADFPLLVPTLQGYDDPDRVFVRAPRDGGQVAFVYRTGERVRVLVMQFRARIEANLIQKSAGPGTTIEEVTVRDKRGFWLKGEPHEFVYVDQVTGEPIFESARLATNTLLWQVGEVTLRIEGELTKQEALRLAESMR